MRGMIPLIIGYDNYFRLFTSRKKMKIFEIAILIVLIANLISASQVLALDISMGFDAGYDNNVTQMPDALDSGFGNYKIRFAQPLTFSHPSLLNNLDGEFFTLFQYKDYFAVRDNYRLEAGTTFSWPIFDKRLIPGIMSDIFFFRDNLIESDSRNEWGAGVFINWVTGNRLNFELWHNQWRADYRQSIIYKGSNSGSGKGQSNNKNLSKSRYDRIQITGLNGTFFCSSEFQTDVILEYSRIQSSVSSESSRGKTATAVLNWTPRKVWEVYFQGSAAKIDYENRVETPYREDKVTNICFGLSRYFQYVTLKISFERENNHSSLPDETYHQEVIQCGFILFF